MDDTTKEIIALRTEVAEFKEMIKALLDKQLKIAKPAHIHDAKKKHRYSYTTKYD